MKIYWFKCQVIQQKNNIYERIILVHIGHDLNGYLNYSKWIAVCRYMYLKINVHKFPSLKFDTCLYFEHNRVFTIE